MKLIIDTAQNNKISIAVKKNKSVLMEKKIDAPFQQAEKLLPLIDGALSEGGFKLSGVKEIIVRNKPLAGQNASFTSLRIGVITANALAYALGVPVKGENGQAVKKGKITVVKPIYGRKPNITTKKK